MAPTQPYELARPARRELIEALHMRRGEVAIRAAAQMTLDGAAVDLAGQLAARRIERRAADRAIDEVRRTIRPLPAPRHGGAQPRRARRRRARRRGGSVTIASRVSRRQPERA
jgi:hypothetical protein